MTIWKYRLPTRGTVAIDMPKGAELLSVHNQNDCIVLWAAVDDRKPTQPRTFDVRVTGSCYATFTNVKFIGTVLLDDGAYVAHVFEVIDA